MFAKLFKNKKTYTQESTTRILSLDLESHWIEDTDTPTPLTFIKDKDGKGALQVSLVTFDDLRKPTIDELLGSREKPKDLKEYQVREWTVYEYDKMVEELYCKTFYFVKTDVFAFFTYTGSLESKGSKELQEAVNIAKSIKVMSKN
jgi:hypothetical protein